MAAQSYEIPLVPHGLRPAETYMQVCEALGTLQQTASTIFDTVERRVESERGRLRAISSRIRAAEAQIESLAGSSKAVTIYSSARYPATQQRGDYEPVFGIKTPKEDALPRQIPGVIPFNGDWRDRAQGSEEALELFRFFSAAATQDGVGHKESQGPRSPTSVQSTANIFLFDGRETIFDEPTASTSRPAQQDTRHNDQRRKEADQKAAREEVKSIIQGDAMAADDADEYAFRPTLEAVPALDLPAVLPDLPMIADISWTGGEEEAEAAPWPRAQPQSESGRSRSATSSRPSSASDSKGPGDLGPAVADFTRTSASPGSHVTASPDAPRRASVNESSRSEVPRVPAPLAAPVPAITTVKADVSNTKTDASGRVADVARPLSPPPPPPAPPLPKREASPSLPATAGDPARTALLDSIRNPGVQLRKVSQDRSRTPSPRKELMAAVKGGSAIDASRARSGSAPLPQGDMVAEMASQLMSRRLSMKGGLQAAAKEEPVGEADEPSRLLTSPPPSLSQRPVPKTPNLAALVAQRIMKRPAESDDDEDDEWDD